MNTARLFQRLRKVDGDLCSQHGGDLRRPRADMQARGKILRRHALADGNRRADSLLRIAGDMRGLLYLAEETERDATALNLIKLNKICISLLTTMRQSVILIADAGFGVVCIIGRLCLPVQ